MFDFAWTEIALIGVVALVAIGPKDLPVAIKTVAGMIKKARRMAAEFQTHVDDLVREADLHEVRDQIAQLRNFDIRGEITKAVDADGSIRSSLSNPLATTPAATDATTGTGTTGVEAPGVEPRPADPTGPETNVGAHHVLEHAHEGTALDQSRNATETRVIERPAASIVAPPAHHVAAEEVPAFIPPGVQRV